MLRKIVLVGGSGFVGTHLAAALLEEGYDVLILDVNPPLAIDHDKSKKNPRRKSGQINFGPIDITDKDATIASLRSFQPSLLVHLASYGMSGPAMLNARCEKVNVGGTSNLIEACIQLNIPGFIYTSSYNVIFGGEKIEGGDETTPYFPVNKHSDEYSRTKALAEQLALKSNGKMLANGNQTLVTASIRPAAIYGEDEQRHLPRVVKHIDNGFFLCRIGTALVDWVYIDNLVSAYMLLISKMVKGTASPSTRGSEAFKGGQAYFISDGTPIDNFLFFKPLCLARGREFPQTVCPTALMLSVSKFLELLYKCTGIEPPLIQAEVLKVGVSHYFSIDKARRELGYEPVVTSQEGAMRIAKHYHEKLSNEDFFQFPAWYLQVGVFLGMLLLFLCAYCDAQGQLLQSAVMAPVLQLGLLLFRSQAVLRTVFVSAEVVHVMEAIIAFRTASALGCANTRYYWLVQTFLWGFPSLSLIQARESLMKRRSSSTPR